MENESLIPLKKPYGIKKPRGNKLPPAIRNQINPVEGKSSLRSIAKGYEVRHSNLSATAYGDRNTPHLIQILEMEFNLPIAEIRKIFQKAREARAEFKKLQSENGKRVSQSAEAQAILKNMGFKEK
ncbi:hypothetical protein JWG45_14535 [Leptospira sp. 201903070]|uniref:XRE family transcriptional regulator n=1 Tax=Leptospira ainlahdjerensis TaxID=2810033 RepID=A0ABS2UDB4_9LEPT|nr:hypothetical protein [Leptospira ainlahdjerensis]MBM9578366.1 hypothetical protein [Leptospira ainlahdjerensis]